MAALRSAGYSFVRLREQSPRLFWPEAQVRNNVAVSRRDVTAMEVVVPRARGHQKLSQAHSK